MEPTHPRPLSESYETCPIPHNLFLFCSHCRSIHLKCEAYSWAFCVSPSEDTLPEVTVSSHCVERTKHLIVPAFVSSLGGGAAEDRCRDDRFTQNFLFQFWNLPHPVPSTSLGTRRLTRHSRKHPPSSIALWPQHGRCLDHVLRELHNSICVFSFGCAPSHAAEVTHVP